MTSKNEKPSSTESRVKRDASSVKKRTLRPFPASPFEEALDFARKIYQFGSGQTVRKLSLFNELGKSPDSGASRQLITNANKYGLIKGGYQAEQIEITQEGTKAVDENVSPRESARTRIKLAIEDIEPFKFLYERFCNMKLPARAALVDTIKESGVTDEFAEEGVDTFIVNLRFVQLLQTLSGADRIVSIDHLLDNLPQSSRSSGISSNHMGVEVLPKSQSMTTQEQASFDTTCFYITPIGEMDSPQRKHSDLFLASIVEPALNSFGLSVIRADAIDKPGMITRQVIEYILRSRLVIADLSFHNPNVFYELALRHAIKLPVVQIIRSKDRPPFDVNQMRTINIDDTDIYALVPKLETYKSEIASQVRRALEPDAIHDNPISVYFPNFSVTIGS